MSDDQIILDPSIPGNIHSGTRLMLQRKATNAQEAYQVACFWWELLTINPPLQPLCRAQIEAQSDWANTNAAEAEVILKQDYGKASPWATHTTEMAQFWAAEVQVLLGRADSFRADDAPVWASKKYDQLTQMGFVQEALINGLVVALVPSVGRGALLQPLITQDHHGHKPLDLVEDRTTAQRLEDGDVTEPPAYCKTCRAPLVLVNGKAHSYTHCTMCSDPARFYVIRDGQGNWKLDPNPPTPKTRKGQERIASNGMAKMD